FLDDFPQICLQTRSSPSTIARVLTMLTPSVCWFGLQTRSSPSAIASKQTHFLLFSTLVVSRPEAVPAPLQGLPRSSHAASHLAPHFASGASRWPVRIAEFVLKTCKAWLVDWCERCYSDCHHDATRSVQQLNAFALF